MTTISSQNQEEEQLLSIGQASEYLGISIDTLRRWERKGRIEPFRSPGGHRYYKKTLLDSLFGKRYTRDEETIRRSFKKEEPQEVAEKVSEPPAKLGLPSWRAIKEEIIIEETEEKNEDLNSSQFSLPISHTKPLDRPVREVQIPQPVRIEVIKRDLLLTPEEAYLRQQNITLLNPPRETVEEKAEGSTETLVPQTPIITEPENKKVSEKDEAQNRKMIIISSIFAGVILLSIAWYIAWVSSQRVLSPVP